ncbi:MAG: hypothetical protein ACXVDD_04020 [Polyangia bacterium]
MSTAACGGQLLTWRAQPAAPALSGKVMIAVADHRVGNQGGDDPSVIGSERGALLIPSTLRLSEPTEAAATIRDLLGQAALTAGIGVAAHGELTGTAKLAVEIQSLWCDGVLLAYTKARLGASLAVLAPDGAVRLADVPIQVEGGGASCRDAYQTMLTNAYSQAAAIMSQPQVRGALTGSGGAPPTP